MSTMPNTIQIVDINHELTKLWNSEQDKKKIRASLFTLILYVQKSENSDFYQNIIKKSVISKFPCRVIMIINEITPTQEYLKTEVSSETIGAGEQKIFCEIIKIEVAGSLIERVPYMVLPHILPDLPVYLLWTQDPSKENAVLPHLEPLANRTIFDPKSTDNLQNYCLSILSLMNRFHCNIGDLNWSAISGWRHIFANTFNDLESFLTLAHSNIIRIQYNKNIRQSQKNTEMKAAYFQAWLASRLNWKFRDMEINEGNIRITYQRSLKEVVFLLNSLNADTESPGAILAVEIESAKNSGHYFFKKQPQNQQVFIQYSERDFCQLPISSYLGNCVDGNEIIEEIFYASSGTHYHTMLKVLAQISWRSL